MELIIDTNRIIAALIKNSQCRKIILSGKHKFFTVEFGKKEIKKYKKLITTKANITEMQFSYLMDKLLSKIIVYNENEISKKSTRLALKTMKEIDIDDVPFLALSIELGKIPIWTDNKHFKKQKLVKIIETKNLA